MSIPAYIAGFGRHCFPGFERAEIGREFTDFGKCIECHFLFDGSAYWASLIYSDLTCYRVSSLFVYRFYLLGFTALGMSCASALTIRCSEWPPRPSLTFVFGALRIPSMRSTAAFSHHPPWLPCVPSGSLPRRPPGISNTSLPARFPAPFTKSPSAIRWASARTEPTGFSRRRIRVFVSFFGIVTSWVVCAAAEPERSAEEFAGWPCRDHSLAFVRQRHRARSWAK